jgi:predicted RNA binding protein YcfA (HicA-like mRNA interferase family)
MLQDAGYRFSRSGKGSHQIWEDRKTGRKVSVPAQILSRHTANNILKSASIGKKV